MRKKNGYATRGQVWMIPTGDILPNSNQPRKEFALDKLVELAQSISENGVLAAGLDVEVGKQAVQYQVCGPAPPPTRCRALPSGRGCRAGALGWTS